MSPRGQILSLTGAYFAAGLFWGTLAAAAPAVQARAGLDAGGFGLALGVMALAAFPVMQGFGRIVQRIRSLAIPLSAGAFALGAALLAVADDFFMLYAAFIVIGGASGALDISLNLRTAAVEAATGARLFNRTHAIVPVAMLSGSVATGWSRSEGVSITVIFGVVALVIAVAAAIEWRAGREDHGDTGARGTGRAQLGMVVAILGVMAALAAFQEAATNAWAAIFVETIRGEGPVLSGLAAAAYTLGLAVGRLGAHEVERWLRPLTTVRLAALLGAPAFAAVLLDMPSALLLVAFLLAGVGVGPVEPAVFKAVSTRGEPSTAGRRLAAVTQIAYLGYLISPPVLGLVAEGAGFQALWLVVAAAALSVAGLSLLIARRA